MPDKLESCPPNQPRRDNSHSDDRHATAPPVDVPIELVKTMRSIAGHIVERISYQIQNDVTAYAGPPGGRRSQIVHTAVHTVVNHFLNTLERNPSPNDQAFELVRKLGHAEALEGHSLDAMRAAHHVAIQLAWSEIRQFGTDSKVEPNIITILIDALFAYIDQLIEMVTLGHAAALASMTQDPHAARRGLIGALLNGHPRDLYERLLGPANWSPPDEVVVLTAAIGTIVDRRMLPTFGAHILVGVTPDQMTIITGAEVVPPIRDALLRTPGIGPIAVSWSVSFDQVRDAYRWTSRTLELSAKGLIEPAAVIDCNDYASILWLHSDPALSRHACEELLAPLQHEKPHQQRVLAETLLLWLQGRESASTLAVRVKIHEQTARRRIRQLKKMFGEELSDPQKTLALLSALEATAPKWRSPGKVQGGITSRTD